MFDLLSQKGLKTGEMLKMLKMLNLLGGTSDVKVGILRLPQNSFNIFSIFNTSPVLSTFRERRFSIFNIFPVLSSFCPKCALNEGNVKYCVLLGGHICNISSVLSTFRAKRA